MGMFALTVVRHRVVLPSTVAMLIACVGCAPTIDPGGDAANDTRTDRDVSEDANRVADAAMNVDAGVTNDGASAGDAEQDGAHSQPDGESVEACVPQCAGRVCGDDRCGGTCGTCGGGAMCTSAGVCTLNEIMGGGQWSITAVQGEVSPRKPNGDEWDLGINATYRLPDPKVCITVGSAREECSGVINNTIAPAWNYRFSIGVDTAQLTGGMLRVRLVDDDTAFDDTICPLATVTVTEAQIMARTFTYRCASGGVEFFLTPR